MQIINLKEKLQNELNNFNKKSPIHSSTLIMGNHQKCVAN